MIIHPKIEISNTHIYIFIRGKAFSSLTSEVTCLITIDMSTFYGVCMYGRCHVQLLSILESILLNTYTSRILFLECNNKKVVSPIIQL